MQQPAERPHLLYYIIITGTNRLRFPFHAQGLHAASETTREPCVGYREELCAPFDCEGRGVRQLVHRMRRCAVQTHKWLVDRVTGYEHLSHYDHVRTKRTRAGRSKLPGVANLIGREVNFSWQWSYTTKRHIQHERFCGLGRLHLILRDVKVVGRASTLERKYVSSFCRHFAVLF